MDELKDQVKYCGMCETVKPLEISYYKAGKSWQKYCKLCHNKKRREYTKSRTPYVSKKTGFSKLPEKLQKKIIYDIYIKINFKDIYNKYKDEYPQLKYQTLLYFNKHKQIEKYKPLT